MSRDEHFTIGELAEKADVTTRTIRYYIDEGLLPPGGGTSQRFYGYEHYLRLRLVKLLRAEDVPLKKIRERLEQVSLTEIEELVGLGNQINQLRKSREGEARMADGRDLLAAVLSGNASPIGKRGHRRNVQPLLLRQNIPMREPTSLNLQRGLWRKVLLADGVELSYEVVPDAMRESAIQTLIAEGIRILSKL